MEDVREMATHCSVRRTLVGHHDPNRTWFEQLEIDDALRKYGDENGVQIELARAECVVDL